MKSPATIALPQMGQRIQEPWTPKILGHVNTTAIKLVKTQGEFCWHHHEHEDELFLVISGQLQMHFRDKIEVVNPGELIIVPHGVEHCPVSDQETLVLLVEPDTTLNTGNVENKLTQYQLESLE